MEPLIKLIYIGDPMCSWCWGFAPEIESLSKDFDIEVVVGGLRPGPSAQALTDRMADFLRHHWVEIAERTGQAFDIGFLDRRDGWVYDTEPAAVAVVTMRDLHESGTLGYFTDIQRAFYAEGRDVTDFDVLADLVTAYPVDQKVFRSRLESQAAKQSAWADFGRARNWGISGFPALVGELTGDRLALLARGWTRADVIRSRIASIDEADAG